MSRGEGEQEEQGAGRGKGSRGVEGKQEQKGLGVVFVGIGGAVCQGSPAPLPPCPKTPLRPKLPCSFAPFPKAFQPGSRPNAAVDRP